MQIFMKKIMLFAVLGILVNPSIMYASEVTDLVKSVINGALDVMKDKTLKGPEKAKERKTRIRNVIENHMNFLEMARLSLGKHWKKRSSQEKKEFVEFFSDLILSSYIRKIEAYENEEILYVKERVIKKKSMVKTKVITKKGLVIPVDYRLLKGKEGNWRIYDIVIEGVSLIRNYRTQFNEIIRSSSYEEIEKQMKSKVE